MQRVVDRSERNVDIPLVLGTRKNNLPRDEDKEHNLKLSQHILVPSARGQSNLGYQHTVDETREQLRLIAAVVLMSICKLLQADGKANIARSHDVLYLELCELGAEP